MVLFSVAHFLPPSYFYILVFSPPTVDGISVYDGDLGRSVSAIRPYDFVVRKKIEFLFLAPV